MWLMSIMAMIQMGTTTIISIPKGDILHKQSGLILQYLSEYKPSNDVISLKIALPVSGDMCYLLPLTVMEKIVQCNDKSKQNGKNSNVVDRGDKFQDIVDQRRKRFITDIIAIAVGTAATTISTTNTIQIINLQNELKSLTSTLETMKTSLNNQQSQSARLIDDQIEITTELQHTQAALNNTIALVNEHSKQLKQNRMAMNTLLSMFQLLKKELNSFTQAVETHFIHESIEDIIANKLNLRFIHHYDLPRVIKLIKTKANLDINKKNLDLPSIEIINRLLIQQRIHFIPINEDPKNEQDIIGNLVFISLIAATKRSQQAFSTYQLTPIPFNHENQRVKLANMPYTISISTNTLELIQWTKEESDRCELKFTSTCRESPPIRRNWDETCLFQILTDANLTLCKIEQEFDPVFIRRVGQQWAISTRNETRCHRVILTDRDEHTVTNNNQIIIPPIALITTEQSTSLSCDNFILPKTTRDTTEFISIIENKKIRKMESQLIDLCQTLTNNTQWKKIPYLPDHMKAVIEHVMTLTPRVSITTTSQADDSMAIPTISITLSIVAMLLVIGSTFAYFFHMAIQKRKTKTIVMPQI